MALLSVYFTLMALLVAKLDGGPWRLAMNQI